MLQIGRPHLDRLDDVPEHVEIDRDLLRIAPAGDEARFLVERGIDDVRHPDEIRRMGAAGCGVAQIQAPEPGRRLEIRPDRKSVVLGKSVSVREELGDRRILKKKKKNIKKTT